MQKEAWMWLAMGMGFGAVNSGELLSACPGGPAEVQAALGSEKLDEILTQKQAEKLAATRPEDYALDLARAEAQGIQALPYDDRMFPGLLRSIANPPLLLYVKGDLTLLNGQLSVGMVGARRPSGYGVEAVRTIGRGVALGGAIIISGLAAGLDSEAHKAALAVNGPTIACIAFGHDNCYPAQNKKLMEVIERYGAVISEYPPATKPEKPYFLHRNRLIAGLSHALVVTEARRHSGTMSTVNFATDYGRDVFAVPGSIFSELSGGTNAMIRDGAYLAASAGDILSLYGIELPEEDLAKAVAAQAQEGRPAQAAQPWQSLDEAPPRRPMERQLISAEDPAPAAGKTGEQTLLEALQNQLTAADKRTGDDRVSRNAAIDAFRRLQQEMPPANDEALDARNRALDEMVAAVSDEVDIRRPASRQPGERSQRRLEWERQLADEPEADEKVKPFRWDAVEHLTKADLAKRERENAAKAAKPAPPVQRSRQPVVPISAVQPVGGLAPVGRVAPVAGGIPLARALPQSHPAMRPQRAATAPPAAPQQAAPPPPSPFAPVYDVPPLYGQTQPAAQAFAPPQAPPPAYEAPPAAPEAPAAAPAQRQQAAAKPLVIPEMDGAAPPEPPPAARPAKPAPKAERSLLGSFRQDDLAAKLRTLQKPPAEERRHTFAAPPAKQAGAGVYTPRDGFAGHSPAAVPPSQPFQPPVLVREGTAPPLAPPEPPSLSAQYQFPPEELAEMEALDELSEGAKLAFEQLGVNPLSLAQIAKRSGLTPGEAMAALTELELAGLSRQLPGRQFVIMQ